MGGGASKRADETGGNGAPRGSGTPAIDYDPIRTVAEFEGEGRGAAARIGPARRRRRRIENEDRRFCFEPLIAPAARLAQRTGAYARAFDGGAKAPPRAHVSALPARQRFVTQRHRQQSRDRAAEAVGDRFWKLLARGDVDGAKLAQQFDQGELPGRG